MTKSRESRVFRAGVVFLAAGALLLSFPRPLSASFLRGDLDGGGKINLTDPIRLLRFLFLGAEASLPCDDAADANDDGQLNVADAVHLLGYLFLGGPSPRGLSDGCWIDPTQDDLACERSPGCSLGLFFAVDKSGSIVGAVFQKEKDEVVRAVGQLRSPDQFGIAFFDSNLTRFPASGAPAEANEELRAAALEFVGSVSTGHGTCPLGALVACLQFAAQSSAERKVIIFMIDGYPTCAGSDAATYMQRVLDEVTARNTGGVAINAVGVGPQDPAVQDWLAELAGRNGGEYSEI